MHLPLEIRFDPPTKAGLGTAARAIAAAAAATLLVGASTVVVPAKLAGTARPQESATGLLRVASVPAGALIEHGGHVVGRTPTILTLPVGEHHITLRSDMFSVATYQVGIEAGETGSLNAELWLESAAARPIRPPLPGAMVTNASFLSGGDVALLLALPSSTERQMWVIARNGQPARVGPARADGPLAISVDGLRVAYLAPGQGSRTVGRRLEELWVSDRSGGHAERVWVLPASRTDEALTDLAWAPTAQHLIFISRQQTSFGGTQSRLLWLTVGEAEPREMFVLPGDVVPGSFSWSPGGDHVAFLLRTPQATSLCLLRTADSEFRYLGDVRRTDASALPFPPIGWAPDGGRLVYAALTTTRAPTGWWQFGGGVRSALYVADLSSPQPQPLGKAEGHFPAWRADGAVVVLSQPKGNGPLVVGLVDAQGGTGTLSTLPIDPGAGYAARWDLAHAQALIAIRNSSPIGGPRTDYWLVRFRPEPQP